MTKTRLLLLVLCTFLIAFTGLVTAQQAVQETVYVPHVDDRSAELVVDPDFEDSSLGGWIGDTENIWTGNFIKNPPAMPYRGDHFVWFGDYAKPTVASLSQTLTIPATGNAMFTFYLLTQHASVAHGATDKLEISLDGVVLSPTPIYANDTTYQGDGTYGNSYRRVVIDVSVYADGNPHLLKLETTQTGSAKADDITNFFIDQLSLRTGADINSNDFSGRGFTHADFDGNWGIDLAPSILNFGFVEPGQTATRTVTVINTGSTPLVGTAHPPGPQYAPSNFAVDNADYDIPPGGTGTVEISFTPTESETYHEYMHFEGGGTHSIWVFANSVRGVSMPNSRKVIINELSPRNTRGIRDEDGDRSDWIELKNFEEVPVLLDGWQIEYIPKGGNTTTWPFPNGVTIGAKGYLVVYASGKAGRRGSCGSGQHVRCN
ncbi:MAG: lamin tail domain-containing protein [Candidatus Hydrogenedentes bacterium]|nr:lamin tail domain-containing protein [Candidatus Hydrogenedentota bacterium]